jgi:hypothetical protein
LRRIYDLRHTFATFALRAGISTFELSRYMGTSLLMIDRHYGHLARDGHEHAIRLLDSSADVDVHRHGRSVDVAALAPGSSRTTKPRERRRKARSPESDSNRRPLPYHFSSPVCGCLRLFAIFAC